MIGQVNKSMRAQAQKIVAGDVTQNGFFVKEGEFDKATGKLLIDRQLIIDRAKTFLETHKHF